MESLSKIEFSEGATICFKFKKYIIQEWRPCHDNPLA